MTEEAAEYIVEVAGKDKPCPFCGSDRLEPNSWYIDDEEVDAFECAKCKAGAPQRVWNSRPETCAITQTEQNAWHYPRDNADIESMPAPGQKVILFYEGEDSQPVGPVISTPIHAEGLHILNGKSIYRRSIRWCAIPGE